jgi:hypothetical protein
VTDAEVITELVARAKSAPPRKPIWNTIQMVGDPPMTLPQAVWGHVSRYVDTPTPRGPRSLYSIPHENIRQFARTCRDGGRIELPTGTLIVTAGAPVILDWESWYDPARLPKDEVQHGVGLSLANVAEILSGYVRAFKDEWPDSRVGVYPLTGLGMGPPSQEEWERGLTADEVARAWEPNAVDAAIVAECDFLNPSPYLNGPLWVDRDIAAYRNMMRLCKARHPTKPLYPMVTTNWMVDERIVIPDDIARRFRDEMLECSDGLMVWSAYGRDHAERQYGGGRKAK